MQRAVLQSLCATTVILSAHLAHADLATARAVCTWDEWSGGADHEGAACVAAQPATRELAHIVFDPFEFQEIAETRGNLIVHYPTPISDADDNFFMLQKAGTYVSCNPPGTRAPGCGTDRANLLREVWTEKAYHFRPDGSVQDRWTFTSDWKPIPFSIEQMFQATLSGPFLYIPGAGGSVFQVVKQTGQATQRIKPFAKLDPDMFVTGGISIDRFGLLYWNVMRVDPVTGAHTGFLVAASPWGATKVVAYDHLIPGAPRATDLCFTRAPDDQIACGPQRPGIGVTPAIGADGTVFTATRADNQPNYSYVVALRPDLSVKWATSLRGIVSDGCFVDGGTLGGVSELECPPGVPEGSVDPTTNLPPAQQVEDQSSSSPIALPDGGVAFGVMRDYDFGRGLLLKLDHRGALTAHFDFGWDSTPAVYRHDGTYSIITKDNHYFDIPDQSGPFYLTQVSADLEPEWRYENTTAEACVLGPDGALSCTPRDPLFTGFEWCVNAPAVDKDGTVIATSEDGDLYVIGQGGVLKSQIFLNQSLGAVYTPAAIDARGRIYALNNGELSIYGK